MKPITNKIKGAATLALIVLSLNCFVVPAAGFTTPISYASVDTRPFVTPPPGPGPDRQTGPHDGLATEASCDIMKVTGFAGEYVLYDAGPVVEPTVQEFFAVIKVRGRNPDHSWNNNYTHYAVRFTLDCTNLIYEYRISAANYYDLAGAQLSFYYPGGRFRGQAIYALFGTQTRDSTAAFNAGILNIYFGDVDKQPLQ